MVRQSGKQGKFMSRQFKMTENKKEGTFILVNFATGYGHLSESQFLFPKGKTPKGDNYWNSLNGVFISYGGMLVLLLMSLHRFLDYLFQFRPNCAKKISCVCCKKLKTSSWCLPV